MNCHLLIVIAAQKFAASLNLPMNTLAEEAPTTNLLPAWFHTASMFDFDSFITAICGNNMLTSEGDFYQTMMPLSVEALKSKPVTGCQSSELTGFKC